MLRKLFKYDFGASIRSTGLVYTALILASILGGIVLNFKSNETTIGVLTIFIITIMATAVAMLTLVHICNRFEKNLFSGQGYLMHTLPVRTWQLITSKLLVAFLLCIFAAIAICAAVFLLLIGASEFQFGAFLLEIWLLKNALFQADPTLVLSFVLLALSLLASIPNFVLSLYAACTVGYAVGKACKWVSVGTFFALRIVESIVSSLVFLRLDSLSLSVSAAEDNIMVSVNHTGVISLLASLILTVIFAAAYFVLTEALMRKRLNLE